MNMIHFLLGPCFFPSCFIIFSMQILHTFCQFIPKDFMGFDANINGTVAYIFIFQFIAHLQKYNWILYISLYLVTLLNSHISSISFYVDSLGFSWQNKHIICKYVISSFLIRISVISLPCLIVLTRASSTILNRRKCELTS